MRGILGRAVDEGRDLHPDETREYIKHSDEFDVLTKQIDATGVPQQTSIAAGCNAKALSTYMGHASVTITYDRYGPPYAG